MEPKANRTNSTMRVDPEAEAVLPLLESDLCELILQAANGELKDRVLRWKNGYSCDVVLVSGGYPGKYEKGKVINIPENHDNDIVVYHSGTKIEGDTAVTSGGRVLNVVGFGNTLSGAIEKAYIHVETINFENMFILCTRAFQLRRSSMYSFIHFG